MPEEENNITSPAPTGGATPEIGEDPLLKSLTDRVMGQSDIVRSGADKISDAFELARQDIIEGKESTQEATELQFEGLREEAKDTSRTEQQAFSESRRGFATNTAILRDLKESADKKIKDLARMEQEAYAQGNSEAAEKLASLRLQEVEYTQNAEQQIYNNMIQEMTAGLQIREGERSQKRLQMEQQRLQQDEVKIETEKRMFMANIASQHGVKLEDGDDIEKLLTRVSEKDLSEREQAELDLIYSQIKTEETQNRRLQHEIAMTQREADQPAGSSEGFTSKETQDSFRMRTAAYRNSLFEMQQENPDMDMNPYYQHYTEMLANEFGGDIDGGNSAARDLAKRYLGLTPAGEEAVTFNDNLEDLPGTSYFEKGSYSESLPDVTTPWNTDYSSVPIGSRSLYGGMFGSTLPSSKLNIGGSTPDDLKYRSEEDRKEVEKEEEARRAGLTR